MGNMPLDQYFSTMSVGYKLYHWPQYWEGDTHDSTTGHRGARPRRQCNLKKHELSSAELKRMRVEYEDWLRYKEAERDKKRAYRDQLQKIIDWYHGYYVGRKISRRRMILLRFITDIYFRTKIADRLSLVIRCPVCGKSAIGSTSRVDCTVWACGHCELGGVRGNPRAARLTERVLNKRYMLDKRYDKVNITGGVTPWDL
jgi:ribosomal protein L37AE/L43A